MIQVCLSPFLTLECIPVSSRGGDLQRECLLLEWVCDSVSPSEEQTPCQVDANTAVHVTEIAKVDAGYLDVLVWLPSALDAYSLCLRKSEVVPSV